MKRNKGLTLIVALLLIITTIALCIAMYAWAKYTTQSSGNATAQVAKWNFDLRLREGKSGATETSGPIDLASTQFSHVANDRIAPGTSGLFYVIIDTTGTEVDCKYDVNIDLSNCPRNIKFYRGTDETGELLSSGGENTTRRSFNFSKYLAVKKDNNGTIENENGKHEETIYWVWDYQGEINGSATTYDEWDTTDSNLGTTTMTITATGTQMLEKNKVQILAQIGEIQQWDRVNYNPGSQTTASIDLPAGATLSSEISASSATDWVVLDVNKSTGEVLIIPQTYSSSTLNLEGIDGYNNAIEALNSVAKIYKSSDYATTSRSLTVEDINKVVNYYVQSGENTTNSWMHRYGMDENLNIVDYGEENANIERTYTSTKLTEHYSYQTPSNISSYWNSCWLASRCVQISSNGCNFFVRILNRGRMNSRQMVYIGYYGPKDMPQYYGTVVSPMSGSFSVIPVISLKPSVSMNKDGNGIWQLTAE